LSDEFGIPRLIRPLIGGLLGGSRSRRAAGSIDDGTSIGGRGERIPSDDQLAGLLQDSLLVLPPRYFIGYFLDLLI
jgi:hypothetical protein